MHNGRTVSVVFPAYNEEAGITHAVESFLGMVPVDEVVVVDNNSRDQTAELAARAGARVVSEAAQGYGNALRRGLAEASGDLVVMAEPDGTFFAPDVHKLLAYAEDAELVLGTRTTRELIFAEANMGWFLRWGNWAVAKMMEFLFNSTNLTDVGCTTRLIRRSALGRIEPHFTVGGSSFGPEMMLLTLLLGLKIIQIPVNYLPRVGESSVTGDVRKAFMLGLGMIGLVLRYRVRSWLGWRPSSIRARRAA
jgi:glycosyltransferase involved in cell wall biosynthesis